MRVISPTAKIGEGVSIGLFTVISEEVSIGSNVVISNNVTIYPGVRVGDNVYIEAGAVLGRQPRPAKTSTLHITQRLAPLEVGAGTIVGAGAVLYAGSVIGLNCLLGDTAIVREGCKISDFVIIGSGTVVENSVTIRIKTKIQSCSYITAYTSIGENCFIAPMVTTTNDNFMGRTKERFRHIKGAQIQNGARVGGSSILLPGVIIGEESFIAAGSVVTKDTEPGKMYKGIPAREFRSVPEEEMLKGDER